MRKGACTACLGDRSRTASAVDGGAADANATVVGNLSAEIAMQVMIQQRLRHRRVSLP
ncbi:MAG: hypothetical protein H0T17_01020 [Propionibacteriales bacterium]|nr:hypothetical protein [Propionibacteriales bacterium]